MLPFTESVEHLLSEINRQGPIDGILGFSQGATMAALFTAQILAPSRDVSCATAERRRNGPTPYNLEAKGERKGSKDPQAF